MATKGKTAQVAGGSAPARKRDLDMELRQLHHFESIVHCMKEMREGSELSDVVISVDGAEIQCHRLLLASCSQYFRAMFTNELFESKQRTIEIQDVDADTMKLTVEFMYTGDVSLNANNVQNLLTAAAMFNLPLLEDLCCKYLQAELHPTNCLGIRQFAGVHGCFELQSCADKYVQQHFKEVAKTEEFLQLSSEDLIDLISRDSLNVRQEEDVFNIVINWLEKDMDARMKYLEPIFEHVRLPLVKWDFLRERVGKHQLFTTRDDCKRFLKEARQFHSQLYHPDILQFQFNSAVLRARPRQYFGQKEYIYIVGGETSPGRTTLTSIEVYHPYTKNWSELPNLQVGMRGTGTAIFDGYLYCIGGCDGMKALNSTFQLCLQEKTWQTCAPMTECRSSVAVTVLDGFIYACGGYNDMCSVKSVEKFDPDLKVWSKVGDMVVARSMAGAVEMDNVLYVVGGYDGITDLKSCEKYTEKMNKWTSIAEMNVFRCMPDVAALKGKLYAVGGMDHNESVSTVEVYDPVVNIWTMIASMNHPRSGVGVSAIGNHIYALGGYDGKEHLNSVEKYDTETDEWSVVGHMCNKRWRFGCCC